MQRISLLALVLAAACGSSGSKPADATTDSPKPIDAPPDVAVDASAMAAGGHYHYVIDRELIPTTNQQARDYGLDLNNDGMVDNQLGMVIATFAGMGLPIQSTADTAVNNGTILMLADVQATALTDATDAGFTVYVGENPQPPPCNGPGDTTCRHHLQGTGTFDVAAMPQDTPLVGAFASGTYTGGPGHIPLEVIVIGGSPLTIDLIGARAQVTANVSAIPQGIIGGGIPQSEITTKVYPGIVSAGNTQIAADCNDPTNPPTCGCTSGSTGATLLGLFDGDYSGDARDCMLELQEVSMNSLIQVLFTPDVMLEGQMALSLGIGFTAVPGGFTSP
ncbi:MAG TPA: hypothetical protein VMJ10_13495 [Kofleriaceae bacterium]|nr:hypothetical protein [Kofleriaceae bacterium]